ncbi:adenylosuccinate synthetase [Candidatus Woesearchaeota archaeon]|nr:adenylosuccinate synthetase [Candidatus Woesearchaeota archaeon]
MTNKVVDCVAGMQWGSEGKGKVVAYLAKEYNAVIRSGGPQAGHTFYLDGMKYVNRQVPCGVANPDCKLYLSANSLVNIDVLAKELSCFSIYPDRLMIDDHAMVVTAEHAEMERLASLKEKLASTLEGVGAAQSEKVWRRAKLFDFHASEDPELYFFCDDTVRAINEQINNGHPVLLEGTQGFGLCLNLGSYPFVTSRDVTASALLSDAGISPKHHNQTIGVMRTYPIRVGGNSGPTESKEIDWKEVTRRSRSPDPILEYTTVTGRVRRVFEQSYPVLDRAMTVNRPDQIALMFLDYINHDDFGKTSFDGLSPESQEYVYSLENRLGTPITLIGTGPEEIHMIDRRTEEQRAVPVSEPWLNDFFPSNTYGHPWDSGFIEQFIDRKMTDRQGEPFKRRIFLSDY